MSKEKKGKKKGIIILSIILGVAILAIIALAFLYFNKPKYNVTINTNGGELEKEIVIKKEVIIELPVLKERDDYELVCWVNDENKSVRRGLEIKKDTNLKAIWREKEKEYVTVTFVTGLERQTTNIDDSIDVNNIPPLTMEKGTKIILPVSPTREGYKFVAWVNEDNYIVDSDTIIDKDTTLRAIWLEEKKEMVSISFDTGTDEIIGDIVVNKGENVILPVPKKSKEGYKFDSWKDEEGNTFDKNTKVEKDTKLIAVWKETYTCPKDCTPIKDGSKCTKETEKEKIETTECPSNATLYYGNCIDLSTKEYGRECAHDNSEIIWADSKNLAYCVKKVSKVKVKKCPVGYEEKNKKCYKTETLECKSNKKDA